MQQYLNLERETFFFDSNSQILHPSLPSSGHMWFFT